MGSAVGQVPDYACLITEWVKEVATTPVIVKLTPNVTDVVYPARAAKKGGADAVSLINTINSIMGVDLDTFTPRPDVGGRSAHGGYCGPAVKPIALNMVSSVAKDPRGAVADLAASAASPTGTTRPSSCCSGARRVQVCTAVMHYGFRIVEDMIDGLSNYLDEKGFRSVNELIGRSLPSVSKWEELDLNYKIVARHRSAEVHRLRAVLRRRAPTARTSRSRRAPSTGARTARSSSRPASAATCARWSAPSTAASRWCASTPGGRR